MRVPLDSVVAGNITIEYPGVTAVVAPLGLEETSRWNDAFPLDIAGNRSMPSQAATSLVLQQLIRIEGLTMKDADGNDQPFDAKNPVHVRSIPMDMRSAIYLALLRRADLAGDTEKNSGSPSVSGGTSDGSDTPAQTAADKPETT